MKKLLGTVALASSVAYVLKRHTYVTNHVAYDLRNIYSYLPLAIPSPRIMGMIPASQATVIPERQLVTGTTKRSIVGNSPDADKQPFEAILIEPEHRSDLDGAVLWIHGGGHVVGTAGIDVDRASYLAFQLGIPVLSVDYHQSNAGGQFPGDHNECYAALRWLQSRAGEMNFNPQKIAVSGSSAGGGLAAGIVQRAADEGNDVAFQALVYPMLDHETTYRSRENDKGRGKITWTHNANVGAWETYLRDVDRDNLPAYASPAQYEPVEKLPATWIGVGDIDLFFEEDKAYAERLSAAGVETEFYIADGMYHGADALAPESPTAQKMVDSLIAAIRRGLSS